MSWQRFRNLLNYGVNEFVRLQKPLGTGPRLPDLRVLVADAIPAWRARRRVLPVLILKSHLDANIAALANNENSLCHTPANLRSPADTSDAPPPMNRTPMLNRIAVQASAKIAPFLDLPSVLHDRITHAVAMSCSYWLTSSTHSRRCAGRRWQPVSRMFSAAAFLVYMALIAAVTISLTL